MRKLTLSLLSVTLACLGVGVSAAQADRWVGEATPNPDLIFNQLYGVSCASPNACEAVGSSFEARWDGMSWQLQPDATNGTGELTAVSCSRADACTAVGTYVASRWNGTSWTVQTLPTAAGAPALQGVSCPTLSFCSAVGSAGSGALVERWNGSSWSIQPTVSVGTSDVFNGVSCTAADACTAVGVDQGSSGQVPLIERWNGASWSVESNPVPLGASQAALNGVSCTAAQRCMAVGQSMLPSGSFRTLAELWNGTSWSIRSTPTPPPTPPGDAVDGILESVSCHTAQFCVATGVRVVLGEIGIAIAERWDGASWRLIPSPFGDAGQLGLESVSCPTLTRCQAVGYATSPQSTASFTVAARYQS